MTSEPDKSSPKICSPKICGRQAARGTNLLPFPAVARRPLMGGWRVHAKSERPENEVSPKPMANHNNFGTNEVGRARHSVRAVREMSCDGAQGVTRPTFTPPSKNA